MITQFKELWSNLGANQKISLILASGLVALAMIGMMVWASRPDMQLLYGGLNPEDMGKMIDAIDKNGTPYELGSNGSSIYVNASDVHRLRAELAQQGIQSNGSGPGWELFDSGSFGISDFVQRTNYKRAIQGELSRTISLFGGIKTARVSVNMPETRLLSTREGQDRPTASVLIEGSNIDTGTVNSIRHYVANAIQGLNVNDVVVVDTQGNYLTEELQGDGMGIGISGSAIRYQQKLEAYYTNKVQKMLDNVLGGNQAEVAVGVVVDTTSVQKTETLFDPESQVARTTTTQEDGDIERERSGDTGLDTGATGISANSPAATTTGGSNGSLMERESKNKTKTENFEINQTVVNSVQNPGAIKRVSASILVAKQLQGEGASVTAVDRSPEEIEELRQIVMTALGITPLPGESAASYVTVKEMRFAADPHVDYVEMMRNDQRMEKIIEMSKNAIGIVLGLGVIIFFMQMMKRHKPEKISVEVLQPEQMLHSRKLEDTSVVTPEMLNELIRQKPANVGVSLRQWIGEEVGKK